MIDAETGRIAGLESDAIELTVDSDGNPVASYPNLHIPPRMPSRNEFGWRAKKGPNPKNTSEFRATGHRVLILSEEQEETTKGGIVLAKSVVDKEAAAMVFGTVIEIGFDAWTDKTTDYCDVGERVMVGKYVGKFHVSEKDGKTYRFVSDLDIITPIFK